MSGNRRLGLDELMIVNPDEGGGEALLFGDNGALYRIEGLNQAPSGAEPQFFLGDDGILYQLQSAATLHGNARTDASAQAFGEDHSSITGRFFLGSDGTLYEVVDRVKRR